MEQRIEMTAEARAVLKDLQTLPEWGLAAIARGMDKANQVALANIELKHLTGKGPFPVEDHRLGVVTNRLRGAAHATPSTVSGNTINSAIGDNVVYAAIHEFGGVIHKFPKAGKVRLRTNAQGELMRQAANAHLAVFAKSTHTRVKEVDFVAQAHDVTMPERAPFRTGIAEVLDQYGTIVSDEFLGAWNRKNVKDGNV